VPRPDRIAFRYADFEDGNFLIFERRKERLQPSQVIVNRRLVRAVMLAYFV
jgi:hypothetical protein